jgi:very-short-patch-repair endonuclease
MSAMPKYGTSEWFSMIGKRGGQARAAMPSFKAHQRVAGKARAEAGDMAEIGRKGAQVTLRRYGYAFLFARLRAFRLANPSRLERQVAAILDYLNYPYEREVQVIEAEYILVDFYLPECNDAVIEVNGRVHTDPYFRRDPERDRRILDARRRRKLERAGFRVLEIDYRELVSEFDARLKIINFLLA